MAGRALFTALADELQTQANRHFDRDPVDLALGTVQPADLLDYVCARVESGTTTKALCRELTAKIGRDLTYDQLRRFLTARYGSERVAGALDTARTRASHCLAEEALEIVDAPAYDSVTVQQARAKANQRNWLASRYNPEQYGQQRTGANVSVQLNVSTLHLEALQRADSQALPVTDTPAPLPQAQAPQRLSDT